MTTYIAVYDDYTPQIFGSLKSVVERFSHYTIDGETPATFKTMREEIKTRGFCYLYSENSSEWFIKVFAM